MFSLMYDLIFFFDFRELMRYFKSSMFSFKLLISSIFFIYQLFSITTYHNILYKQAYINIEETNAMLAIICMLYFF